MNRLFFTPYDPNIQITVDGGTALSDDTNDQDEQQGGSAAPRGYHALDGLRQRLTALERRLVKLEHYDEAAEAGRIAMRFACFAQRRKRRGNGRNSTAKE